VWYNAFIAYSHSADHRLAATLETALHRFAKPWRQIRKNLTVFRDKSNLTPNPHLWPTIESALHDSEYFLLPASFAAASHLVQKEVHCWLDNHREANFLIGLTDGAIAWDNQQNDFAWDRTNALPQQFSTSEKTKLQFRAGAFNLSNTPTFTLPVATNAAHQWGNKAFGKLTGPQTRGAASAVRPEIFILTSLKRSM